MPRLSRSLLSSPVFPAVALFAAVISSAPIVRAQPAVPTPKLPDRTIFPKDNPWNTDISAYPVAPNSDAIIARMNPARGLHPDFGTTWAGVPNGIPFTIVPGDQPRVPVTFDYADESDPGPYPIPPDAPIEGGPTSTGDRHVIVVDRDHWKLYEMWNAHPDGQGGWHAGSGAVFDLNSNALRPAGWTSADAAGLPILPGLVRYDEVVEKGVINHAIRFTMVRTRRAYIPPATHFASPHTDPDLPPMGLRLRLKANVDISRFSAANQVLLTALKKYGLTLADNGSDWYISGVPDPRWSDDDLGNLRGIKGADFEVVETGEVVTR